MHSKTYPNLILGHIVQKILTSHDIFNLCNLGQNIQSDKNVISFDPYVRKFGYVLECPLHSLQVVY